MKRFWKALVVSGALVFSGAKANINVSQLLAYETSMPAQQILSQEYENELGNLLEQHCGAYRSYYQCVKHESPFDLLPYHRAKFALELFSNGFNMKVKGSVIVDRSSKRMAYWVKDGIVYVWEEGKDVEKIGKASDLGYTEGEFTIFVPDKTKKSMEFVGKALARKLGFNPKMFNAKFLSSLGKSYVEQSDGIFGTPLASVSSKAIASLTPPSVPGSNGRTVGASTRIVIKFPPKEVIQQMIARAKEKARRMAEWRGEVLEKVKNLPKAPKVPVKTKNMKLNLW